MNSRFNTNGYGLFKSVMFNELTFKFGYCTTKTINIALFTELGWNY